MKTIQRVFLWSIVAVLWACAGGDFSDHTASDQALSVGGSSITELSGQTVSRPQTFRQSSFSKYVYLDEANQKLLLDWNFFPSTRYDSSAKTLTLPCEVSVSQTTVDGLNYNQSVPLGVDDDCTTDLVVDLSEATFEVYGLVFSFDGVLDVLLYDFDLLITSGGFKDSEGRILSVDSNQADLVHLILEY